MINRIYYLCVLILGNYCLFAQQTLEVEGVLVLKNSQNLSTPEPGTIRWNGTDFEGWIGDRWVSLTYGHTDVQDIQGNLYKTVRIGNQIWMAENLRTTQYKNASRITNGSRQGSLTEGAFNYPNNSIFNVEDYGLLYNQLAAQSVHGLCPEGWRVPTTTDFLNLYSYLGGASIAGGRLKEKSTAHWLAPNEIDAASYAAFNARAAGSVFLDSGTTNFGVYANFWTTNPTVIYYLTNYSLAGSNANHDVSTYNSVRCIKN